MKILRSLVVFLASSVAVCSSVLIAHGKEENQEDMVFRWTQYRSNGTSLSVYSGLPPASYKGISLVHKVSGVLSGAVKEGPAKVTTDTLIRQKKRMRSLSSSLKKSHISSGSSVSSS